MASETRILYPGMAASEEEAAAESMAVALAAAKSQLAHVQDQLFEMTVQKQHVENEKKLERSKAQAVRDELTATKRDAERVQLALEAEKDAMSEQVRALTAASQATLTENEALVAQLTKLQAEMTLKNSEIKRLSAVEDELEGLRETAAATQANLDTQNKQLQMQRTASQALCCVYLRHVALLKRRVRDGLEREEQVQGELQVARDARANAQTALLAREQQAVRERERLLNQVKLEVQRGQATVQAFESAKHEREVLISHLEECNQQSKEAGDRLKELRDALGAGERQLSAKNAELVQERSWYVTLVRLLVLCQGRLREIEGIFGSLIVPGGISAGSLDERRPSLPHAAVGSNVRHTLQHLASVQLGDLQSIEGEEKHKRLAALAAAIEFADAARLPSTRSLIGKASPMREQDSSPRASPMACGEGSVVLSTPSSPLGQVEPLLTGHAAPTSRKVEMGGKTALPRNASVALRGGHATERAWTPPWHVETAVPKWEEQLTEPLALATIPRIERTPLKPSSSTPQMSPPRPLSGEQPEPDLHVLLNTAVPTPPMAFASRPLLNSRSSSITASRTRAATAGGTAHVAPGGLWGPRATHKGFKQL